MRFLKILNCFDWWVIIIIIALMLLTGFAINSSNNQTNKCNDLGGFYIEGQCLKAELIKMD